MLSTKLCASVMFNYETVPTTFQKNDTVSKQVFNIDATVYCVSGLSDTVCIPISNSIITLFTFILYQWESGAYDACPQ